MRLNLDRSQREQCLAALKCIMDANKDERGEIQYGECSSVESEFADWLQAKGIVIPYQEIARSLITPHIAARKKLWRPRQLALDFAPMALLSLDVNEPIVVEAKDADAQQLRRHEAVLDEVHRRATEAYQADKAGLAELHSKFRTQSDRLLAVMIREYGWTPPAWLEGQE